MSGGQLAVLILLMTLLGSLASLSLKKASGVEGFARALRAPTLYIGALLYLVCAVLNVVVLRYMDYSVVLPLTSLTYVWTLGIAKAALGETVTARKVAGVVIVCAGAALITL